MKMAEKELQEIEKKKNAAISIQVQSESKENLKKTPNDVNKERMNELTKQIEADAKRMAVIRSELQKLRSTLGTGVDHKKEHTTTTTTTTSTKAVPKDDKRILAAANAIAAAAAGVPTAPINMRGIPSKPVPEGIIPDLCKMILKGGTDGINKIIVQFVDKYPTMSKRQVEKKVMEIAVKEKRGSENTKV
jgi:hypothetical protein